jgi:hypothetical protein
MYTTFSPWLIIVAMILLLAMVGCIVITIKSSEFSSRNVVFSDVTKNIDNSVKKIRAGRGGTAA